jgi:hypothetical protein
MGGWAGTRNVRDFERLGVRAVDPFGKAPLRIVILEGEDIWVIPESV